MSIAILILILITTRLRSRYRSKAPIIAKKFAKTLLLVKKDDDMRKDGDTDAKTTPK